MPLDMLKAIATTGTPSWPSSRHYGRKIFLQIFWFLMIRVGPVGVFCWILCSGLVPAHQLSSLSRFQIRMTAQIPNKICQDWWAHNRQCFHRGVNGGHASATASAVAKRILSWASKSSASLDSTSEAFQLASSEDTSEPLSSKICIGWTPEKAVAQLEPKPFGTILCVDLAVFKIHVSHDMGTGTVHDVRHGPDTQPPNIFWNNNFDIVCFFSARWFVSKCRMWDCASQSPRAKKLYMHKWNVEKMESYLHYISWMWAGDPTRWPKILEHNKVVVFSFVSIF